MSTIINTPYDAETRVRIAEMRQERAVKQSINDAGKYVAISMKNNKLTADNVLLRRQIGDMMSTVHAVAGYPVRLMLAAPGVM